MRQVRLFSTVFNGAIWANTILRAFVDLELMLSSRGITLEVRVIDNGSTDQTFGILSEFALQHPFLTLSRHQTNLGNATGILEGYSWAIQNLDDRDFAGCCDFDNEHDPRDFVWYLDFLEDSAEGQDYDGVAGSIIYPQHKPNWADLNMMRFLGAIQSRMIDTEPFYIQSPGFNLHRVEHLRRVITEVLPAYQQFLTRRELEVPRWGMHGVILHLLGLIGAHIYSAYLKCLGPAPNRDWQKLMSQAKAALFHTEMVLAFAREYGLE